MLFNCLLERFDHDFFGVVDFIHHQPETAGHRPASTTMLIALDSPHRALGRSSLHLQFPVQIDERQQPAAQPVNRRAVDHLDSFARLLAFQAHQFQQADLRNRVAFARRWSQSAPE